VKIATWNVNSLRARLERVTAWLERQRPDVLCLQETKCPDEQFPSAAFEALGYEVAFAGEPGGLNGVATLSRCPLGPVRSELPGRADDAQRRFLAARCGELEVINVYVPNGQALGSDAFFYKLDWLSRLQAYLVGEREPTCPLVLLGDFNIAPDGRDVGVGEDSEGALHCSPHERRALGYLEAWGLRDALRVRTDQAGIYSWFDYRETTRRFDPGRGLRIDLIYVTAPLVPRVADVAVDLEERAGERPSDHAPVLLTLTP